ncbi:nucleoside deaminase [Corynebacterium spheniscorum]|uniref:tRNA-specific adenosine deaminase n=1 Tax=Corynebacterium spheniscorum TaxID=185761 RepID=A0A1I2V1D6_9CORY|nr:nucleoside deaminase [Corynebacterium spheniscorum]KAA8719743.1 nucleoside deaminase [Corynebacterium spheniscorum]SFG82279.1 tRNA-adenosine deaminase [Corynebacterium spheniscorum]
MVLPPTIGVARAEKLMRQAIAHAAHTPVEDVPVAALVFGPGDELLAAATNRREADGDPTAHAEILAIQQAAALGRDGWRLSDCTLVVTLEPCCMCAGAIMGARVKEIIFGAFEPRTGACGSVWDLLRDPGTLHHPEVRGGVLAAECEELLTEFFLNLRCE